VDPITEGYLLSIAELNAEYTQLSQDLGENHPDLVHLRGSGKELYGLVQAQLESRVRSLAAQVHEQEDEVARLRTELGRLPGDLVAISEPMLTAEIQQKLLPALLTSLHTAEIAHESTSTRVELLDQAEPATEVHSPKLLVIVLLGGLLGLALGATLAFVRAPISAAIQRPDELQLAASAEVLAVVPCTAPGRAHPLDPEGDAREAQGLRSLRAALQHAGAGRVERLAVGLTSPVDAPLRTRLALGLAQAMGQAGVRTLVVDLDLDSEALRQELGCEPASGLLALLSTPEPEGWRAAVQESALLGIDYLGAGADGSPDLLAGPAFASLLQELGAAYPFVLLDLPSTGSGSTLEAVAGSVDGILVVARSGHTRKLTVETLAQRIRRAGGRLLGCVLLTRAGARHA